MTWLELKIPPLLVLVVFMLLNWMMAALTVSFEFSCLIKSSLIIFFTFAGIGICTAGVIAFRLAKTTVNPMAPESSTSVVTSGIYRYTRNPMYLGFLCILIAWSIYLAAPSAVIGVVGFIVYLNKFQIKPEEQALEKQFLDDYQIYRNSVRRWL